MLPAGVPRRRSRMPQPDVEVTLRRKALGEQNPKPVSLPLFLNSKTRRQGAFHVFVDAADRQAEIEGVLHAGLERRFVPDIGQIGRRVSGGGRSAREFAYQKIVGREIEGRRVRGLQIAVDRMIRADAVAVAVHALVYLVCRLLLEKKKNAINYLTG